MLAAPRLSRARAAWERLKLSLDDPPDPRAAPAGALWAEVRGALRAHPVAADALLTVALGAIATPFLVRNSPDLERSVLQIALLVPLVWRRRHPVGTFALIGLVALAQWTLDQRLVADIALLVALYTVADRRSRRLAGLAAGALELGVVMASLRWPVDGSPFRSFLFLTAMAAAALLLGVTMRGRAARLASLTERAERLEYERDQQARLAAVAERTRIAREMHDVLAHSLAVIISLADGAAVKLGREPERAGEAIRSIAELGRESLRDTRRLLGVLRADDGPGSTAPQPGIAQLDGLLVGVRSTGLVASLRASGEPFDVPAGAGLNVYRIVQEALTNAIKHASGATAVDIELCYADPTLTITVRDDGQGAAHPRSISGHGLEGMRERASVHRGSVESGPVVSGGWRVSARLLVGPSALR